MFRETIYKSYFYFYIYSTIREHTSNYSLFPKRSYWKSKAGHAQVQSYHAINTLIIDATPTVKTYDENK